MGLVSSQNRPRSETWVLMARLWALVLRRGRSMLTKEKERVALERQGRDFKLKLTITGGKGEGILRPDITPDSRQKVVAHNTYKDRSSKPLQRKKRQPASVRLSRGREVWRR